MPKKKGIHQDKVFKTKHKRATTKENQNEKRGHKNNAPSQRMIPSLSNGHDKKKSSQIMNSVTKLIESAGESRIN